MNSPFQLSLYLNDRDHAAHVRRRLLLHFDADLLLIPTAHQFPFPPPPRRMPLRIIKSGDQQASIFLHKKLKLGSSTSPFPSPFPSSCLLPIRPNPEERARIINTICAQGGEMMMYWCAPFLFSSSFASSPRAKQLGRWAIEHCLEAATGPEECRKIVACMRGRILDLTTNCYEYHVLQKALDCKEEVCFLIVLELLRGNPATILVNKHASHVWRDHEV
ncbi:hypothetical protein B0H14DRAFT_3516005 [Mycena olivaceomarginata]|nr:hypothetical protein B0H14DRAFT_3516005 [Mycena olivaceomarginata]